MMATISYGIALYRHPKAVASIIEKLERSRSKDKDCNPLHYEWTYSWGISSRRVMLSDPDEDIRMIAECIHGIKLVATKDRKYSWELVWLFKRDGFASMPLEVLAQVPSTYTSSLLPRES